MNALKWSVDNLFTKASGLEDESEKRADKLETFIIKLKHSFSEE